MKTTKTNLLSWTLSLILAGSCAAQAQTLSATYVDDGLDLVDLELEEQSKGARDVELLAEGLEPAFLEPAMAEPDYMEGQGVPADESKTMKANTGPLVGTNYIRIYVDGESSSAGSNTDYIYARFGQRQGDDDGSDPYELRLWGYEEGSDHSFPGGWALTWDLEALRDYLEDMPQDNWDEISLVTPSGDGILIDRVIVVHSGMEILDWDADRWLDSPDESALGCAAMITERKLEHVGHSDNAAIHFGALELGKTDGFKYGTGNLWCSEFASWELYKEGFMTPYGNIGTDNMKAWFEDRGRLYTRSQVTSKTYVPRQGDYLSINGGGHSCLFLEWVDSTDTITTSTRFRTLDGNWGQTVTIVTRTVAEIDRVGNAQ